MNPAGRQLADQIGRPAIRDLDDVEAELLCRKPGPVGVSLRKPTGVGPTVVVDAEHDDFRRGFGLWFSTYVVGHDVLLESKRAPTGPLG